MGQAQINPMIEYEQPSMPTIARPKIGAQLWMSSSQRTLTMFVGVVALRYQHHTC